MSAPRFDLVDIAQTLKRRGVFMLIITLLAAVVGAVFYFAGTTKYKAMTEFFVANPQYADRNNTFTREQTSFIDYFGDEEDIDKALVIGNSELARQLVVQRNKLAQAYHFDTTKSADLAKLSKMYRKNLDIKRTEYRSIKISYTDTDPDRAANVCNDVVRVIEDLYHGYYSGMRGNIANALKIKLGETDSAIAVLTDSLANLRDRYGIYDIVSPNRSNVITGSMKSGNGRGIEEVQNVESVKDQLVSDRAKYISLLGEVTTGTKAGEMPLLQVMSSAYPPDSPAGLGPVLTILACAFIGFFFAAVWSLLAAYFKALTQVQR